jgi:hypothetical protein
MSHEASIAPKIVAGSAPVRRRIASVASRCSAEYKTTAVRMSIAPAFAGHASRGVIVFPGLHDKLSAR